MGLDQYANARKGEPTTDEDGYKKWEDSKELAYWRKHPNLQGFMEDLWETKGRPNANKSSDENPFGSEFNCVDLELTLEDIDSLEASVKGEHLPETGGFFFGEDSDEWYKESDLEFVEQAKQAIDDGYTVIYSSWW